MSDSRRCGSAAGDGRPDAMRMALREAEARGWRARRTKKKRRESEKKKKEKRK